MPFISHPLIKPNTVESKLYQEILSVRVLEKGNSLVVAPTALGKTVIALMVSAEILKQKKKVLFLAPTKPLAVQHEKSMKKFLKIKDEDIVLITGATPAEKRKKLIENAKIISATPQCVQNDSVNGKMNLDEFGLIIFDEAHRAIGNYAYVFIAEQYIKQCKKPLVLALTASPGGDEEKIQSVCRNLFVKNVEIKTHEDSDVKEYVNKINVEWVRVNLPKTFLEVKILLDNFQKKQITAMKQMGFGIGKNYFSRKDMLIMQSSIRRELLSEGQKNPILFSAISRIAALLKVAHALTMLETQGTTALNEYMQKMFLDSEKATSSKAVKMIVKDEGIIKAEVLVKKLIEEKIIHPKLEALQNILVKQFTSKPASKVLVFNHYRGNIREMEKYLEKIDSIKPKRFVGQATKGNDKGMTQKVQVQTINELKEGKYNCLIASSVAEEGLDIPQVDLVVFYEPVPSEIRMIQRRGRTGRKEEGKAIILMAKNTRDEAFYYASRAKEKKMKSTLKQLQNPKAIPEKKIGPQTTLMKYTSQKEDEVNIYVDTREQASSVTIKLKNLGANVNVKQLEIGDFIISNKIVIERKTIEDFLNSLMDGRLFNQLKLMTSNYDAPLIILEGNQHELFTTRNIHENAIKAALASIALNYRVPILYTTDVEDTAKLVYLIAKREQNGKENEIKLRFGRKGLTTQEQQQYLMEGFPLVGPSLAKALLKNFGTVRAAINASIKELKEVEKMGPKKAKKIHEVLNAVFGEDK